MRRGGGAGVLIADGCPMVRAGLKEVLHAIEGAELTGETGSAGETLRLAEELRPEYVVLDHDFGVEESGVSICRALKALPETPVVVIYTRRGSPAEVALARLAGADAFIHKGADLRKLQQIKRAMCRGEPVWYAGPGREQKTKKILESLEGLRLTVLELIVRRRTNEEIAEELHLAPQTVKNHAGSIFAKLGYRGRKELYRAWGA